MRKAFLVSVLLIALLVSGGTAVTAAWASGRHTDFHRQASALRARWATLEQEGLPAAAVSPMEQRLTAADRSQQQWWLHPWSDGNGAVLDRLSQLTDRAWESALAASHGRAARALADWAALQQAQGSWLPAALRPDTAAWSTALQQAATPMAIGHLADLWSTELAQARAAAATAQAAAAAAVSGAGGPDGLLGRADTLQRIAAADNLDAGAVAALADQLHTALAGGAGGADVATRLGAALQSLQAVIALNDRIAGELRALLYPVDQAGAEQTAGAAAESAAFHSAQAAFTAARTGEQMNAVQSQVASLQPAVQADLDANRCGHALPAGKAITISLSLQEMVFYQDGCEVQATPVTTGRPALPTPTGTYHIFDKRSPYLFRSPWPPGSPFWYPNSPVSYVMEFNVGGYYIHDAPWEPESLYGPGSQNGNGASHGCVHTPGAVMAWAYAWTPMGTPVIISG